MKDNYYTNYTNLYKLGSRIKYQQLWYSIHTTLDYDYTYLPLYSKQCLQLYLHSTNNPVLIIHPFRLNIHGQWYINPGSVTVELKAVPPKWYRLLIVHNFQVEDSNPNLHESLAGFYLSEYDQEGWSKPENPPFESRTLRKVGFIKISQISGELDDFQYQWSWL